jgi:uncharacterized cupin superfamily protein
METISVEEVESYAGPAAVKRPLSKALGASELNLNYYELEPGESFAFGYHAHTGQEEVFYVRSGRVTFETEAGDVAVGAGEAVRFAPGEYQRGSNEGSERVVALAFGAPQAAGETEILRACPNCDERTAQRIERAEEGEEGKDGSDANDGSDDGDGLVTLCADCDAETGWFA